MHSQDRAEEKDRARTGAEVNLLELLYALLALLNAILQAPLHLIVLLNRYAELLKLRLCQRHVRRKAVVLRSPLAAGSRDKFHLQGWNHNWRRREISSVSGCRPANVKLSFVSSSDSHTALRGS